MTLYYYQCCQTQKSESPHCVLAASTACYRVTFSPGPCTLLLLAALPDPKRLAKSYEVVEKKKINNPKIITPIAKLSLYYYTFSVIIHPD